MIYNDAHIHFGFHEDIDKINWSSGADYTFAMATGFDTQKENEKILKMQNDKLKCLWWFDEFSDIPKGVFGGKYHAAYTKKPLDNITHGRQLFDLQGKVILVHCGMYKGGAIDSDTSFIHALNIARLYPDTQIILAHMGGSINPIIKEVIKLAKRYDNVWMDTSGITNPLIIEYACKRFDDNRILFGSDLPWCSLTSMLYNVLDAEITGRQKEKILYSNLLKLV